MGKLKFQKDIVTRTNEDQNMRYRFGAGTLN
jgi:hypothetical protein